MAARRAVSAFGGASAGAGLSVEERVQARIAQMSAERDRAIHEHEPTARQEVQVSGMDGGAADSLATPSGPPGRSLSAGNGQSALHNDSLSDGSLDIEDSLSLSPRNAHPRRGLTQRAGHQYANIRAPSTADISVSDSSLELSESHEQSSPAAARRSGGLRHMPVVTEHSDGSGSEHGMERHSSGVMYWGQAGTPRVGTDDSSSPLPRGDAPGSGRLRLPSDSPAAPARQGSLVAGTTDPPVSRPS